MLGVNKHLINYPISTPVRTLLVFKVTWVRCFQTYCKSKAFTIVQRNCSEGGGLPWQRLCSAFRKWQPVKVHSRQKTWKNGPMRCLARRNITHPSWCQDAENRVKCDVIGTLDSEPVRPNVRKVISLTLSLVLPCTSLISYFFCDFLHIES
jgi:hypothetical protein